MKRLTLLLLGMLLLAASCSNDDDNYTEYWTVTIEPEFVLSGPGWGAWGVVTPHMEARDEQGQPIGNFAMQEIKGFTYEEGYRYRLRLKVTDIFKKNGGIIYDASQYKFELSRILSKEHVGISEEGRRELEMDVELARIRPTKEDYPWEYYFLMGKVVGSDETIEMETFEIYGLDDSEFFKSNTETDGATPTYYRIRMRVSITPTPEPIFEDINRRIRLIEIISKEPTDQTTVIYRDDL